jgi:hypothetical protein
MSAVPSAVPSALSGDLVNVATGYPATERYPGAVNPTQYTDPGPAYPVEGPAEGDTEAPFATAAPTVGSGGGLVDTTYLWGTDGPVEALSSGTPTEVNLTYPGARPPALHSDDGTGAVAQRWASIPAYIGTLIRATGIGQTWNREYAFEPTNGMYVPGANGRTDLDQQQMWNPSGPADPGGGYDPWQPGYSERPVLLNVAYQATPVTNTGNIYGVSGFLPDRSVWNEYEAQTYAVPPDPIVEQPGPPSENSQYPGTWF